MADRDRPLYAVLIDADNVPAKYAEGILKEVTKDAEPVLRRAYGDWSRAGLGKWKDRLHKNGIVAYQETANTTGKNASDIGLVIDAMDILHSGRFDGFVLVSSDSDFTRLASRIREQGLEVMGIGARKTPESFVNACERFVYLDLIEVVDPNDPAKSSEEGEDTGGEDEKPVRLEPKEAVPLILKAMESMNPDAEWHSLAILGKMIRRHASDFDTRTFGKKNLSELIKGLNQFKTKKIDSQLYVRDSTKPKSGKSD